MTVDTADYTEPDRVEESIVKSLDLFHTAAITYATLIAEFEQILAEYRQGDIDEHQARTKIYQSTEFITRTHNRTDPDLDDYEYDD